MVNPLQIALLERSEVEPGYALQYTYQGKFRQYGQRCENEGMVFKPLPVETLGSWHEDACVEIKKLGKALARASGQEESDTVRHLFQRLAVLLMKGNAALLINRVPSFPDPQVDGTE